MDFDFAPDTLMLRDMLKRFVQKDVRPLEMKYFTNGRLEPEERDHLRRAIEQMGLWGLTVPEEHGGGVDMVTACLLEIELGKSFVPLEIGEVPQSLYACSGEQISHYLKPALAGERRAILAVREPGRIHPQSWSMQAIPGGNGAQGDYVLNGQKVVETYPKPEDFLVVMARSAQGYSAFLVDADNSQLTCQMSKPGDREFTLQFVNMQVSKHALIGEPDGALQMLASAAPSTRIRLGARYVGIVERLLEMALEHAKDWVVFEAPMSARPAVQRMLAETHAELESARWLVYHAAWLAGLDREDQLRQAAANVRLITGKLLQAAVERVTLVYAGPGPAGGIGPSQFGYSAISPETLEMALEKARAEIATALLDLHPNR